MASHPNRTISETQVQSNKQRKANPKQKKHYPSMVKLGSVTEVNPEKGGFGFPGGFLAVFYNMN